MKRKTIQFACALGLLLGAVVFAQNQGNQDTTSTRAVEGRVLSAGGQPVPGAVVQLKDTKSLQIRSFITQEDGKYHFAGLSTNTDYELKAEHTGSTSGSKTLSSFDSHKTTVIDLKLKK